MTTTTSSYSEDEPLNLVLGEQDAEFMRDIGGEKPSLFSPSAPPLLEAECPNLVCDNHHRVIIMENGTEDVDTEKEEKEKADEVTPEVKRTPTLSDDSDDDEDENRPPTDNEAPASPQPVGGYLANITAIRPCLSPQKLVFLYPGCLVHRHQPMEGDLVKISPCPNSHSFTHLEVCMRERSFKKLPNPEFTPCSPTGPPTLPLTVTTDSGMDSSSEEEYDEGFSPITPPNSPPSGRPAFMTPLTITISPASSHGSMITHTGRSTPPSTPTQGTRRVLIPVWDNSELTRFVGRLDPRSPAPLTEKAARDTLRNGIAPLVAEYRRSVFKTQDPDRVVEIGMEIYHKDPRGNEKRYRPY